MAKRTNSKSSSTATEAAAAVDSFASAFNTSTKEGRFPSFDPGAYYAYVTDGGWHEKDGKESASLKFVLADVEPGKSMRYFFNSLVREDGTTNEVGLGILGRQLTTLGLIDEEGIKSKQHLIDILGDIENNDPIAVVLDVKPKNSKGFTVIEIRSTGEEVENFPEFPETDED